MPLLSAILKPLNSVTRKKYGFSWGPKQTAAFEAAKMPVQTALDLWPVQKGPVELQVSLDDDFKCWSLRLLESEAAGGRQGPRGRRTPPPALRGWVLSHGPHRGRRPRRKSSGSQEPRSARTCAGQRPRLCRVTGPLPGPQRTTAFGPPRASLWPSLSDPQLLRLDTGERSASSWRWTSRAFQPGGGRAGSTSGTRILGAVCGRRGPQSAPCRSALRPRGRRLREEVPAPGGSPSSADKLLEH